MSNNRIEVDTVFGKLFAEVSGAPDYPGILICVEQEEDGETYDKQLALVECTLGIPEDGGHALQLRILSCDTDHEDYTDNFTFLKERPDEEPEEVIWEKYLQYLRDWADSHADPGSIGMTPVCYDEWRDGEYMQEMEGR